MCGFVKICVWVCVGGSVWVRVGCRVIEECKNELGMRGGKRYAAEGEQGV